jgi:hypothetical protein
MTPEEKKADGTFTTSSWLLQEFAIARVVYQKPCVLLVHASVTRKGMQKEWPEIGFTETTFFKAALDGVEQLDSYSRKQISRVA